MVLWHTVAAPAEPLGLQWGWEMLCCLPGVLMVPRAGTASAPARAAPQQRLPEGAQVEDAQCRAG